MRGVGGWPFESHPAGTSRFVVEVATLWYLVPATSGWPDYPSDGNGAGHDGSSRKFFFRKFLKEKLGLVTIPKMTVIGKKTHKARISGKEIIALRTYSEVYIQKTLSWPIDGKNPFNVDLVLGLGHSGLDLVI